MTFGIALPYIFFVITPSWSFIATGLIIQNLCQSCQPASYAIMLDSIPPENSGKVIGCSQCFMYLNQAFTQLLAGALHAYICPQAPLILLSEGALPLSPIAFFKISEAAAREV
jgi:MFS family permease